VNAAIGQYRNYSQMKLAEAQNLPSMPVYQPENFRDFWFCGYVHASLSARFK
jgi:hypothetical protein